jgi:hypothetical protein
MLVGASAMSTMASAARAVEVGKASSGGAVEVWTVRSAITCGRPASLGSH